MIQRCRKPKNIKYHNQRLVLSLLRRDNKLTAGEISASSRLSMTTIMKILSELKERGIVLDMGKGSSTAEGGKKPELYALRADYRYAVSVAAGSSTMRCTILDLRCEVVARAEKRYQRSEDYEASMDDVAELIRSLCREQGIGPEQLCGIAVGFEGIVDAEKGLLRFPIHNQAWGRDLPVAADLEKRLAGFPPLAVNNGSRFAGYSEIRKYPMLSSCRAVSIITGRTTGGCVLDNGALMQGASGLVGELGHITVRQNGSRKCACGNCGCFEDAVSPEALLRYAAICAAEEDGDMRASSLYRKWKDGTLSAEDILEGSAREDQFACRILDQVIEYHLVLIRDIILLYDPHVIVIQGMYARAGSYFRRRLEEGVKHSPFFHMKCGMKILYSESDFVKAEAVGGGLYVINRYFSGDELWKEEM